MTTWQNAYDDSWRGIIVDEAFAHPAKMARGLLRRIFAYLFDTGRLVNGSLVCDPFNGIGSTGIEAAYRGCRYVGVELEPKFYDLTLRNFALHRRTWEACGDPLPVVVCGDSRRLRAVIAEAACVVASPPYLDWKLGSTPIENPNAAKYAIYDSQPGNNGLKDYGTTPGQLGAMPAGDVDAVVASPPFIGCLGDAATAPETKYIRPFLPQPEMVAAYLMEMRMAANLSAAEIDEKLGTVTLYSWFEGRPRGIQIPTPDHWRKLKTILNLDDRFDRGILTIKEVEATGRLTTGKTGHAKIDDYGTTPGQLGAMPAGDVQAVVGSPPWQESLMTKDREFNAQVRPGRTDQFSDYGTTPGQLGAMPAGDVDAVVASPPFMQAQSGGGIVNTGTPAMQGTGGGPSGTGGYRLDAQGTTPGQLGAMPAGDVDAVVASPPYAETHSNPGNDPQPRPGDVRTSQRKHFHEDYGQTPGQLGAMPAGDVEAVVSSPPWEDSDQRGCQQSKVDLLTACKRDGNGHGDKDPTRYVGNDYGTTEGQIGNSTGNTFWTAAAAIVRECYAILRPGGVACWVVKSFVRAGAIVDFPGDWRRLCESCGFRLVEEIHASLVKREEEASLFGGVEVKKTERKSFFRRLHERKRPDLAIDHEVVLVMEKA